MSDAVYKVALFTLGCKLNFAESSAIAQAFKKRGHREVFKAEEADICIINTCTVTEHSDKKSRNLIRKVHKNNPSAKIIVTGCYAQLRAMDIAEIEGVSMVIGQKGRVVDIALELMASAYRSNQGVENSALSIEDPESIQSDLSVFPACSYGERTRSFLKIQDGCNYFCTYCAVPYARGHSRSIPADELIAQAQGLASMGIKEIVITGVNIGDYSDPHTTFLELLKRFNDVEGIERYRLSSIEPNLLTDDIIEWIAMGTKFQPHFHIPLQSGCDSLLKRMGRRYNSAFFKEKIDYIRVRIGDVFFGIDVIVGFPGESDADFKRTVDFITEINPAFLHIFPYSRRVGTVAASLPGQLPEHVKRERVRVLEDLCTKLHNQYRARFKGTTQKVLFESTLRGGMMSGYTGNYIRVEVPYDASLIGTICEVTL